MPHRLREKDAGEGRDQRIRPPQGHRLRDEKGKSPVTDEYIKGIADKGAALLAPLGK